MGLFGIVTLYSSPYGQCYGAEGYYSCSAAYPRSGLTSGSKLYRGWSHYSTSSIPNNGEISQISVTIRGQISDNDCPNNVDVYLNNLDYNDVADWTPDTFAEDKLLFNELRSSSYYTSISNLGDSSDGIALTKILGSSASSKFQSLLASNERFVLGFGSRKSYSVYQESLLCQMVLSTRPYIRVTYCVQETCASLGETCGVHDDTCGGTVDCGSCCDTHDYSSCYSNDVYWYDSCGVREDKKLPDCGSDYYTGSNYCYLNDVYRDRIDNGCSGLSCYSNTIKVRQEDCGALGCSGGVCNPESGWSYQESADSYSINSKIFAITYMKPAGATSNSLWKVKYGGRAIENITIPNDCWNYYLDKIELRFYGCANCYSPIYPIFNYGNVYGQCYNGNWKRITTETGNNAFSRDTSYEDGNPILHDGNWNTGAFNFYDESDWSKSKGNYPNMDATVFEEAMWWDIE